MVYVDLDLTALILHPCQLPRVAFDEEAETEFSHTDWRMTGGRQLEH